MKQILYMMLALSLILSSCEKFLEESPAGSLTTEATLSSQASGVALATGAYRSLTSVTMGMSEWGGNQVGGLEYPTGKAYSQYMGAKLWYYFNLVRYYGDVVFNTEVITDLAKVQRPRTHLTGICDHSSGHNE